MTIYALRAAAAILNFILISFVVRNIAEGIVSDYLLVLGYTVLGALLVGFGLDTGIERYVSRYMSSFSKLQVLSFILAASILRIFLLIVVVAILNWTIAGFVEVSTLSFVFVFFTLFFNTLTSVLNGILEYTPSAYSNLIRSALRFLIFAIPLELASLDTLLAVEIVALLCAASYCIFIFLYSDVRSNAAAPSSETVFSFLGWNYFSRFFLNFVSLNTVKILILRSNHPNAVIYAYAIQLTEAIEKFLPSLVLAGKYRPELSKAFDAQQLVHVRRRIGVLAKYSIISAGVIGLAHLAIIPIAFILLQERSPAGDWPLIVTCGIWLFIVNIKYCLNVVSNVIEANYIQFVASAILSIIFFSIFNLYTVNNPVSILIILAGIMCLYPFIWFVVAFNKIKILKRI